MDTVTDQTRNELKLQSDKKDWIAPSIVFLNAKFTESNGTSLFEDQSGGVAHS